jgi:hypothetical protein
MKYLMKLESFTNNRKLQIGDYVICKEEIVNKIFENFINNNIGRFIEINAGDNSFDEDIPYIILYDNIPQEIKLKPYFSNVFDEYAKDSFVRAMRRREIIHFSPNKEDLELILTANKYNL